MSAWGIVGFVAFLVLLVARALVQPEQPAMKWGIPVGWVALGAGLALDATDRDGPAALALIVCGVIALVVGGVWDRFWRINNGAGTFFF